MRERLSLNTWTPSDDERFLRVNMNEAPWIPNSGRRSSRLTFWLADPESMTADASLQLLGNLANDLELKQQASGNGTAL